MKKWQQWLVGVSALYAGVTWAAAPLDLFSIKQPITANADVVAQRSAASNALRVVVQRLTTDPAALKVPAIKALLEDPTPAVQSQSINGDVLEIHFNAARIQQPLNEAGVATWGRKREPLLVWWVSQHDGEEQLLNDSQPIARAFTEAATYRGFPLQWPLADLEEQTTVNAALLAETKRSEQLDELSQRYATPWRLQVLQDEQDDGVLSAQWVVMLADTTLQGKAQAGTPDELTQKIMSAVAKELIPLQITAAKPEEAIELRVTQASLGGYAALEQQLAPWEGRLMSMSGNELIFRLKANVEQLQDALTEMGLAQDEQSTDWRDAADPLDQPNNGPLVLHYHWRSAR